MQLYLLYLALGDGLSLKPGIGSTLAGVSSWPLGWLACSMREAVEDGHLLRQAEGGQVRLIRDRLLAISRNHSTGRLSWCLMLLVLLLLIQDC